MSNASSMCVICQLNALIVYMRKGFCVQKSSSKNSSYNHREIVYVVIAVLFNPLMKHMS